MRHKILSLLLALAVALPGLMGTAWASPIGDTPEPTTTWTPEMYDGYVSYRTYRAADPVPTLSASNHVLVLYPDGTMYGWGDNRSGQLGFGAAAPTKYAKPTKITFFADKPRPVQVLAVQDASYVRLINGDIYTCGSGANGRLGQGDTTDRKTWTLIADSAALGVIDLVGNPNSGSVYAVTGDNTLLAVGQNDVGQLGLGSTADVMVFTKAMDNADIKSLNVGKDFAVIVQMDGVTKAAGNVTNNVTGIIPMKVMQRYYREGKRLSNGDDTCTYSTVREYPIISPLNFPTYMNTATSIPIGIFKEQNIPKSLGNSGCGHGICSNYWPGAINNPYFIKPIAVDLIPMSRSMQYGNSHGIMQRADGTYIGWGEVSKKQLLGQTAVTDGVVLTTLNNKVAALVAAGNDAPNVHVAGDSNFAHYYDPTADTYHTEGWGSNQRGKLGVDSNLASFGDITPIPALDGVAVEHITGGIGNTYFVASDGGIYTSGDNAYGQLGQGDDYTPLTSNVPLLVNLVAPPKITGVSVSSDWASAATVTITAKDGGAAIKDYAVSSTTTESSTGWQQSATFAVPANGSYYAWARDVDDNLSDPVGFVVDKVDANKPSIEKVTVTDVWAPTNTVTITAIDTGGSNIRDYAISSTATAPTEDAGWQALPGFTITANGDYFAWVRDNAGNVTSAGFTVSKVDTAAPIISQINIPSGWSRSAAVSIDALDADSGIKEYAISSYTYTPSTAWQAEPEFTIDANGDYYAFVRDKAGNVTAATKFEVTTVDRTKPVISKVNIPVDWSGAADITIEATDVGSGIADYAASTSSTAPADGWQQSPTFAVTANGSYYAFARDVVGNVSSGYYCNISRIDTTAPTVGTLLWAEKNTKVTVTGSDWQSGVKGVYINEEFFPGSSTTYALPADARYIRIVIEDNAGNRSAEQVARVPGWFDLLDTLTINPVEFVLNNQKAVITATSTGDEVAGIYINGNWHKGNPVSYVLPYGSKHLELQAQDVNGDRSALYKVRVPGWHEEVSSLSITGVTFAADNSMAQVTALETGGKGIRHISVNGELLAGNPVQYTIPEGVTHLEIFAENNEGDRSPVLIRRVPGWSEVVTTLMISDVAWIDYNTTVQVTATATGGDGVAGIEINGELQQGNPVIYKIPAGVELLKLQAVNSIGDRSPMVTKQVPKDASKSTLKVSIQSPGWTSSDKARVRISAEDKSKITQVLVRTSEDSEWVDVTDERYIMITANTTVYASAENSKGEMRETSKAIECFDTQPPTVTATQDGNVVNIRASDADGSGVAKILVNNKEFAGDAIFGGTLAYRIPGGVTKVTVLAEDAAGNLSRAVELPLQVTTSAMPVIVAPEPEPPAEQSPEEVAIPTPEPQPEPEPEPKPSPAPETPPTQEPPPQTSPVGQAAAAVGGVGTTAAGGVWYWLRKVRLSKPIEELELMGKKLLYDESEYGGAIDPMDFE